MPIPTNLEPEKVQKPECRLLRMPALWDKYPPDPSICPDVSEQEKRDIQAKQYQELQEELRCQAHCSRLDRQSYKIEKEHMYRRLQQEKEERQLQDCLCKTEKDMCKRDTQIRQEENFAVALQRMKEDDIRESAMRRQLYLCSPEIRELEHQIKRAYYARTLHAQRLEGEALKLEEKMRELEAHDLLMEQTRKLDEAEEVKEEEECRKRRELMRTLKMQMEGAGSKTAKKLEEFSQDKKIIDEIMDTMKKEELEDLTEKYSKVKLYQSEIAHAIKSQQEHKKREKERQAEEDRKIREYVQQKAEQEGAARKQREARDAAKAEIVAKTIQRILEDQFKNEEVEDLRRELHEEELAEEVRRKEAEEAAKKYQLMLDLQAAEREAKRLRAEKLEAERQETEEYRKQLMAKFAEDERLELLSKQKRWEKEREHRKKVEEMIIERRARRSMEKEMEQATRNCFDEETKRRANILEQEKIRLLRKHAANILGFIPRGVICSKEDLEKLGEPFLSFYTNIKREPDPSTADTEPCEEELFNRLKVSAANKM